MFTSRRLRLYDRLKFDVTSLKLDVEVRVRWFFTTGSSMTSGSAAATICHLRVLGLFPCGEV